MNTSWRNLGTVVEAPSNYWVVKIDSPFGKLNERVDLLKQLSVVATSGFGKLKDIEEIRDHVTRGKDVLYVAIKDCCVMGFASIEYFDFRPCSLNGTYLSGIAIAPEYQHMGLGKFLIRLLLNNKAASVLAFTTQNPVMYRTLTHFAQQTFPGLNGTAIPISMQRLATKIQQWRGFTINKETFVCPNLYDEFLYNRLPTSGNQEIDRLFLKGLRFTNGTSKDGFLLVGLQG